MRCGKNRGLRLGTGMPSLDTDVWFHVPILRTVWRTHGEISMLGPLFVERKVEGWECLKLRELVYITSRAL